MDTQYNSHVINYCNRKKLFNENQDLAINYAKKYYNKIRGKACLDDFQDLSQEGLCGLVKAIETYDPNKGEKFRSWAPYWIRAYILKYLYNCYELIREPQHIIDQRAKEKRENLQYTKHRIKFITGFFVDDEYVFKTDLLADDSDGEDLYINRQSMSFIDRKIANLPSREKFIISQRYFNNKTYREIGESLRLSHERIRQLEIEIIKKLRNQCDYIRK